ncbi:NAD(P)H-dependent oxidoreductase [Arthrobacter sp. I2-34]|uniref:NAD(P)H-dependent oxidoreductase n=1 Tax=Arthrobacter hankyongi TaxID=2904801 RepID=A0ABS9L3S5_9MICC|nr:NAD(P)H-dependent oxidoreductase [Arthrobacter hankyongi]MCG2621268.1 NAD(P)H-dependent oxidoreductase [Arthrobacter hankyongi]
MKTVVVAGNPKPSSRTLDAGVRLAGLLGAEPPEVLDVIALGPGLLGWGDPEVKHAVELVAGADLAVFASPTFKATYTGLLKLFLDQFATGEGLRGVVAVPLMLGAGPAHALAPELLLKPVLVELGATCPAPGLYQLDSSYDTDSSAADYVRRWGPALTASIGSR